VIQTLMPLDKESKRLMKRRSLHIIRDEHASLAAMLRSMTQLLERGPAEDAQQFFEVMRAMLFYIDEFPEQLHHPKESNLLFPKVAKKAPEVRGAIDRLERDHMHSEKAVRDLLHLLLAWELVGPTRKAGFVDAFGPYVESYLDHMRLEETVVLPAAQESLTDEDWAEVDQAFDQNADPLTGKHPPGPAFEKLFSRIVRKAPAPIGLG
jgi:hemerythrin-like domain-containing protein